MKSKSRTLQEKSLQAMLAAVEIYNKPNFKYREESFSILAINSWEALLKARLLQQDNNKISSITEYQSRPTASGKKSAKLYVKRNRTGNPSTIGLFKAIDRLSEKYGDKIDQSVTLNLEILCEIRDNSVHLCDFSDDLASRIHEVAVASVLNYVTASRRWFGVELMEYCPYILPIGFSRLAGAAVAGSGRSSEENKISSYLELTLNRQAPHASGEHFAASIPLEIRFRRGKEDGLPSIRITNSPDATPVRIDESEFRERYPWNYSNLCAQLERRYSDFVQNKKYHALRKPLESNPSFCGIRHLDPGNPKSGSKKFYHPSIFSVFDQKYTLKRAPKS